MKVMSGLAPDGSPMQRGVSAIFHSLDPLERTGAQIQLLRNVIESAGAFVFENNHPVEGRAVNADVARASAHTIELALSQLNNIVDDQQRWMSTGGEAEKASKDLLESEKARIDSETKMQREVVRPFHMLRAKVYRSTSGQVLAVNDTQSIYAFGDTADEASRNFDKAYHNQRHLPLPASNEEPLSASSVDAEEPPPVVTPVSARKPKKKR